MLVRWRVAFIVSAEIEDWNEHFVGIRGGETEAVRQRPGRLINKPGSTGTTIAIHVTTYVVLDIHLNILC